MTPQQFLSQIKKTEPAPAYLFLGPEPYQRDFCRRTLIQRVLPGEEERENGLTRHDLQEVSLTEVIEDARSLSLFASQRVIVVSNAEAALPRTRSDAAEEDGPASADSKAAAGELAAYMKDPVPGVVLVFEASRFDFQGEDKKKLERVRKFYSAIGAEVEFSQMAPQKAREFAENLAHRAGLEIGPAELDMLVEALGGEAARIAVEIDKLALYASGGRKLTAADISEMVPEARQSTLFALVGALGRNDRVAALDVLETLVRQREYLPLALSFLATQFRLALAAKEANLRTAQQILGHFSKLGVQMWYSRAEQVSQTVARFTRPQLASALKTIFTADRTLRDINPDERIVMEDLILRLTQ